MGLPLLISQSRRNFTTTMTKNNQLKSTPLDLTKTKQLWAAFMHGFKNIKISKDRKLLMLSKNVPEWICLSLSTKAVEIL